MSTLVCLSFLFAFITVIWLKDGPLHKRLYLWQLEKTYTPPISKCMLVILEYEHIINFIDRYKGGGVLYKNKDNNLGINIANKLIQDGYHVIYLSVPPNIKFYTWFNKQFNNIFWWSENKPLHLLYESNLIIILDNYDNMLDNYPNLDDREAYTNNIAVVQAANQGLFKPIFVISRKEYTNEVLRYNGHTKYYNLYSKYFYTLVK